ncbi:hypothetical protein JOC95_001743 [Bacillus tianshenii]|uniref:Uncharacterized protein n=1 Tax=Sutcliffiella tianshenii TaxID=1463404 RepID=A0ABS2NYX9_9BACI|nr:hypothetical protein [Bacillus tianshenii]MBM7619891.1 hypothetical protein [Bacillus tianshenii]
MNKKVVFLIGLLLAGAVILAAVFYLQTPKAFLTEEEIMDELYLTNSTARVKEIQDIVPLDDRSFFVPFILEGDRYASSIWMWLGGKWENVSVTTSSGPISWTSKDGTETFFTWNVDPQDKVEYFQFYLLSERYFQVTNVNANDRIEIYLPKIQMAHRVPVDETSYGAVPIPEEWAGIMESFNDVNDFHGWFMDYQSHQTYFAWQAFNEMDEKIRLEKTYGDGGGGYSTGSYTEPLLFINEGDLE